MNTTTRPDPDLLLCISPDNTMLHVGPAAEVLPHVALSAEAQPAAAKTQLRLPPAPKPLEVYDITGRRVPPVRLPELAQPTDGGATAARRRGGFGDPNRFPPVDHPSRPDRRRLRRRINQSLDFAQAYLTAHPEAGQRGPGIPPATDVPRPRGGYAEVLQALADQLSPLDPNVQTNRGNWFHNLWHAANGTS
jgi:hypothetical protein